MSQIALQIDELEKRLPKSTPQGEMQDWATATKNQDQRKEDAETSQDERLEVTVEYPVDHLADYVMTSFRAAQQARSSAGIDERITNGRRLLRGEYTPAEMSAIQDGDKIDTWYHLIATLRKVAVDFMRSVLVADADNPLWSLSPTNIPNLPADLIEREAEFLALELEKEITLAEPVFNEQGQQITPVTAEQIEESIDEWRENLYHKIDALAEKQTRNLERKVSDVLSVTGMDDLIDDFVDRITADPAACVYGPVISFKKQPEWKNGRKVWVDRQYLEARVVDIDRVWPSEDSSTPQDGTAMFFLDKMTKQYLFKAKNMKGFVKENIEILLKDLQTGCRDWLNPMESEMEDLEDRVYPSWRQEESVDVLKAHITLPGEELIISGLEKHCGKKIDPDNCYDYEIWIVDNRILFQRERVYEGARPFFMASMYPTVGSIWGKGIPHVAEDAQRKANMLDRAEVRDVSYSSGPLFETDIGLLESGESVPDRIVPGLNIKKNSRTNPRGGRILEHTQISSQAMYFNQLKERTFGEAELITGINRQLLGQAQPGVSTLGESQLLQQNAATGLRSILKNIDKNFIVPFVEMVSCLIMMTTDDPSLKADAQVIAHGSTDLLTRELNKNSMLQLFNTLLPMYQNGQPGVMEPEGMACLLREIIKGYGADPNKFVLDPLSARYRRQELQQAQAESSGQGTAGGVSQAPATQAAGAGITPASIGNAALT